MMKRLLLLSSILFIMSESKAQIYSYDFGTIADSLTSGTATSPTFLSTPSDGSSVYTRVGTGGGKLVVKNFANFGTGSSLRLQAPTSGSVNKFAIYGMPNASTTLALKLTFSLGDSINSPASLLSSGTFYFFAGNGATYSNGNAFSGTETFSGVKLTLGGAEAQVAVRGALPSPLTGYGWLSDPSNPITVPYGTSTTVVLYMNNGTTSVNYTDFNGSPRTLAAGTTDLFSNGAFLVNIPGAGLAANTSINSFMFYAEGSTSNEASFFLDDIIYTNNIVNNTLPLKLSSFDAIADNNAVRLFWKAEAESDVKEYIIEHSQDGSHFSEVGKVTSLKTNGSSYTYTHLSPSASNFYRLRIVNENGQSGYSQVVLVKLQNTATDMKAWYNENALHISQHKNAEVKVYDVSGKRVVHTMLNNSDYAIDLSYLNPGNYIAHIRNENETVVVKFVK